MGEVLELYGPWLVNAKGDEAMTEAVKPLTDEELAQFRLPEYQSGPERGFYHREKWYPKDRILATIDALKATPSQSDVEVAREWAEKNHRYDFSREGLVQSIAQLIAASRGTRALTEEEREDVEYARRQYNAGNKIYGDSLVKIISRLTGESET